MKNIDLNNLFKSKIKPVETGPVLAWPVNFVRNWKTVVLVFAIGLVSLSLFAWRIYLSNQIAGGYINPQVEEVGVFVRNIDQSRLEKSLLLLETKQLDYLEFKANSVPVIDPAR